MRAARFTLSCLLVAGGLPFSAAVAQRPAEGYPARAVTVVVPFAAGAVTDIEARLYAQKLAELTGRNFLVDNRAGAGSMIGSAAVAKSPADGYTVLVATPSLPIAPLLFKNLNFDPIKDFTFVSLISKRAPMLLATPSLPVKNVTEYIAYARANPGKLNVGTSGAAGGAHFSMEWLHHTTKTKVTFIHYKGGAPSFSALMAGEVHVAVGSLIAMLAQVRAGKARILGVTSAERVSVLPDVPTVAEQGVPGFEYAPWLGFAVPRGTPAAIVAQLNAHLVKVARSPELAARLADDATLMIGSTPDAFAQTVTAEADRWRKLVDETGMQLEQ